MGWCSGSAELAQNVWELVREFIPAAERKRVAKNFIECFEDFDCDTMQEAEQLYADAGYDETDDELPPDEPGDY